MMKKLMCIPLIALLMTTGCVTTDNSVANYAMGDDSSAIKAGRNKESAQLSRAELEQHRRQRTNVSEELALEGQKRDMKQKEINNNLGTAAKAAGVVGGIAGIISIFK